jgi:hypothetical protein
MKAETQTMVSRADLLEVGRMGEVIGAAVRVHRLSKFRVGLLINFNVPALRKGIVRRVL